MLGSECDLKMHVQNLEWPLSLKSGAKPSFFDVDRNLMVNLKAYNFETKHDVDNR